MRGASFTAVRRVPTVATAGFLALVAVATGLAIELQPVVALAVPAVLGVALVSARRPAGTITVVLVLCGTFGSLQAFNIVQTGPLVDLLLAGLLISVLVSHAVKSRQVALWITPGLALVCLFLLITLFELPTAASIEVGLRSYRYSDWYLLALPLIALAGWSLATYLRIGKAIVGVAFLVAGYAVLRLLIGPASSERDFALIGAGSYNLVDDKLALIGSFPARHSLAFWATCAAPFCVAVSLTQPGRWRLVSAAAAGFCVTAILGTEVRAAIPALVAGIGTVLLLNSFSAVRRGRGIGQSVVTAVVAVAVGASLFSFVVGEDSSRYSAIFSPSGDTSYEQRMTKWRQAVEDIENAPFGKGLGTAGLVQELGQGPFLTQGSYGIDSSYLKIAYEQGFPLMVFYIFALLTLLVGIARQALRVRDAEVRGLGIGAAGSLVAALSMFVTAVYLENLPALTLWIMIGTGIGAMIAMRAKASDQETPPDAAGTATAAHSKPPPKSLANATPAIRESS